MNNITLEILNASNTGVDNTSLLHILNNSTIFTNKFFGKSSNNIQQGGIDKVLSSTDKKAIKEALIAACYCELYLSLAEDTKYLEKVTDTTFLKQITSLPQPKTIREVILNRASFIEVLKQLVDQQKKKALQEEAKAELARATLLLELNKKPVPSNKIK